VTHVRRRANGSGERREGFDVIHGNSGEEGMRSRCLDATPAAGARL
jgi:hypothetical protein